MNIIQTWKTNEIPNHYIPFHENLLKYKNNWNYMFFTDDNIISFIQNQMPEYYYFFSKLQYKIQQIDFFRYLAIYYYGGVYLDLDVFIESNFDNLLQYECAFPIELKNIKDPFLLNKNQNFLVGNYAFYAKPKHPFIKHIINNIVQPKISLEDIQIGCQHNNDPAQQVFVYYTTGPILVSYSYNCYQEKNKIQLLEPNPFQENCFGKYGSHKMYGSWKLVNPSKTLT